MKTEKELWNKKIFYTNLGEKSFYFTIGATIIAIIFLLLGPTSVSLIFSGLQFIPLIVQIGALYKQYEYSKLYWAAVDKRLDEKICSEKCNGK